MAAPIPLDKTALLSSGIGALGSIGSSILGGIINRSNMNAQLENSKELMKYQWDNFQSPRAQVAALAAAGINPSVALGQGGSGFTATPSPAMPSSQPVPVPEIGNIGEFVLAMANAKKAGLESVGKKLENDFNEFTLKERVDSVALENRWKKEDITRIENLIGNIQGQNSKLQVEIDNLRKEGKTLDFENENWKTRFNAEMRKYADEHNISKQEFEQMQEQAPYILGKLKSEDKILNLEAEIQGSYADTNAKLGIVGKVLEILAKLLK